MTAEQLQLIERRSEPRRVLEPDEKLFVKITFPFPKETEIEKEIFDISEHGLSFKMHVSDGYFPPDTPLSDVKILSPEYASRSPYAEVRHVTRLKNKRDLGFNKIGIQFIDRPDECRRLFSIDNLGLKLRAKRYPEDILHLKEKTVSFLNKDGKRIIGSIINFSKFGIAFTIPQENVSINISDVLKDFKIVADNNILYEGQVTIIHIEETEDKLRIGVALKDGWINLDTIINLNEKTELENALAKILATTNEWKKVDLKYKSLVADFRLFLEDLRINMEKSEYRLKMLKWPRNNIEVNRYYQDIFSSISKNLDRYVLELADFAKHFGPDTEEHNIYRAYFQKHAKQFFLLSPFINRIYTKPLGYPGDYLVVDMIYKNDPQGESLFAKLIDFYTLRIDPTQAHRNRIPYLLEKFSKIIDKKDNEVRILSIGSGPAEEIREFIKLQPGKSSKCNVTLLDFDLDALYFSQDRITENKILYKSDMKLSFINRSIIQLLKNSRYHELEGQDIIYCMGLFDYFPTHICRKLVTLLYGYLAPDGLLIISNIHPVNKYRNYMEYIGEWYLHHRDEDEMLGLVKECLNCQKVYTEVDETKVNIFLVIEK